MLNILIRSSVKFIPNGEASFKRKLILLTAIGIRMAGGIYDGLLIIGTLSGCIKSVTSMWLLHNLLIPTFSVTLQKHSWKNYMSAGIQGREFLVSVTIFWCLGCQILIPRDPCTFLPTLLPLTT